MAILINFSVIAFVVLGILVGLLMLDGYWLFLVVFVSALLMFGFYLSVFVVCFVILCILVGFLVFLAIGCSFDCIWQLFFLYLDLFFSWRFIF